MSKGIVNLLEVVLVAIILIIAFLHFFPQYEIKTEWDKKLLEVELRDTMVTIDRLGKTHEFAVQDPDEFEKFMSNVYSLDYRDTVYVWWKGVDGYPGASSDPVPYYTMGSEKSMVDVHRQGNSFYIYTFTVGLGTPY